MLEITYYFEIYNNVFNILNTFNHNTFNTFNKILNKINN